MGCIWHRAMPESQNRVVIDMKHLGLDRFGQATNLSRLGHFCTCSLRLQEVRLFSLTLLAGHLLA